MAKRQEVPQFEGYSHYVLNQRITHHSGSVWIVRALHGPADCVVPHAYDIECEVTGPGAAAGDRRDGASADYVHTSFRPTPNVAEARWRPIESVPTGQWVIVVDSCGEVGTTQIRERDKEQLVRLWEWRYWMPIPEPPTEEEHRAAEQSGGGD